jgi:uncharacterized protein
MVHKLALGTVQFGIPYGINNKVGQVSESEAFRILDMALQQGITTLDTASAYGTAVQVIGKYHRQSNNRFKVISKFHFKPDLTHNYFEQELTTLGIDTYEAMLFHSFQDFKNEVAVNTLLEQKSKGHLNKIGVSIYTNEQFADAMTHAAIDIIQLPFNLLDNRKYRGSLMQEAKKLGKELHVRSAFLQGLFYKDPQSLPLKLSPLAHSIVGIQDVAKQCNKSIGSLALNYVLHNVLVDAVLIGVDSEEQLLENIKNVGPELSATVLETIEKIEVGDINLLSPINW